MYFNASALDTCGVAVSYQAPVQPLDPVKPFPFKAILVSSQRFEWTLMLTGNQNSVGGTSGTNSSN